MRYQKLQNPEYDWTKDDNVEGIDYPYLCEICNKFLSKKDTNWCGDADWIEFKGRCYSWLCSRCCSHD